MKNKKKLIGLVIVLVCLLLCAAFLLTKCEQGTGIRSHHSSEDEETEETTEESTAESTEETTEETTEAEEETTEEPTEETTEPEEEEDPGNSNPGGTGGFTGGEIIDDEEEETTEPEEEVLTVENPGTHTNAYTEYVLELPDVISTVYIPAGGDISYNLYNAQGSILTIADANATVIYDGVTYTADENGLLTLDLTKAEASPISIRIGNTAKKARIFQLNFGLPLGCQANPEILESIDSIERTVDGPYYMVWTAPEDGTLTLTLEAVTPEDAAVTITLTNGETVHVSAEGLAAIRAEKGDEITILVETDAEAQVTISGVYTLDKGTAGNPYDVTLEVIPGSFDTVDIPTGDLVYYQVHGAAGLVLTVETADAYIVYNGVTYEPVDGVITLTLGEEDPVVLAFGNAGETAVLTVQAAYPLGVQQNPEIIEEPQDQTVAVTGGSYYLEWTATDEGILTISASAEGTFDVAATLGETTVLLSECEEGTIFLDVALDDVVTILVSAEADTEVALAMNFTITPGTVNNPYTAYVEELPGSAETVEIPAGACVYYNVYYVSGTDMTVTGENGYIIYNGVTYYPDAEGNICLTVKGASNSNYVEFQVGNSGETAAVYTLSFAPTTGSQGNPQVVYDLTTLNTVIAGGASYYYSYTATADGAVSFWVDEEESTENAVYNIILTCAHYDAETESYTYTYAYLSESENKVVSVPVAEGDTVTIEVASTYWASLAVRGAVFTGEGTEANPYATTVTQIPGGLATVDITNGTEVSFQIYRIGGAILTLEGSDAYVIYNGTTYYAENGLITLELDATMPMAPTTLVVGNLLTEQETLNGQQENAQGYLMRFAYPVGAYGNPEVVTDITSLTVSLEEGNDSGYYLQWTAEEAGTLVLQIDSITEGVTGDITLSTDTASVTLSESEDGTVSLEVEAGTVVTIHVAVLPDENWTYPAAELTISGTLTSAEEEEEETEEPAEEEEEPEESEEPEEPEEPTEGTEEVPEEEPAEEETPAEEPTEPEEPSEQPEEETTPEEPAEPEEPEEEQTSDGEPAEEVTEPETPETETPEEEPEQTEPEETAEEPTEEEVPPETEPEE